MSVAASQELIVLCQAQLKQLRLVFGAISAVIYLADPASHTAEPTFVPVVSYPEALSSTSFSDGPFQGYAAGMPLALSSAESKAIERIETPASEQVIFENAVGVSQQLVLPLLYTDVIVGLMVVIRSDRPWQPEEHHQLQGVASGIAAGCVLDRQNHWLQKRLQAKRTLQGRQSEIFHNLLHQFRNPLTALNTFGQLLRRRLQSEDPNYSVADNIVRQSSRLQALIDDFDETVDQGDQELQKELNTAHLLPPAPESTRVVASGLKSLPAETEAGRLSREADEMALSTTTVLPAKGLGRPLRLAVESLSVLLQPLWLVTEAIATERQMRTWCQLVAVDVLVDQEALQEVVANLMDNALKYSPVGAWVWLQTGQQRCHQGQIYEAIVVGDTGPGIPAADQVHLFQRHYRGIQSAGAIPGTGLGLAIAIDLISQMHGMIDVISPVINTDWFPHPLQAQLQGQATGSGTAFIVWLPSIGARSQPLPSS